MTLNMDNIKNIIDKQKDFSGVVFVEKNGDKIFENGYGYANKSYFVFNEKNTRFGIASGCKIFTSVAICQLVEKGKISFDTYLKDCLDIEFPEFDPDIKIHHLLTHSSGVPDYFDEEVMDDFSELWKDRPMYNIKTPKDFLPMFQNRKMDFKPGKEFKYNNTGFILLGLIVEQQSGMKFTEYVKKNIFEPCGMIDSGYFPLDKMPERTACGYIQDETGEWKTNIYSLPIMGGPDGGAFTTAEDLSRFWDALTNNKILSKETTEKMLTPHMDLDGGFYYGYGVWIMKKDDDIFKYYIMGEDPGVSMMSSIYPKYNAKVTVLGNTEYGTWDIVKEIQNLI